MSDFDALGYWEKRHIELKDDHRNVGNRGLTSEQNRELIVAKSAIVAHAIGFHGIARGARILDAGCGAGAFTEVLQAAGFDMTGIDGSQSAIAHASENGSATYGTASLSEIKADVPFDVVLCLDVLFHVVDDSEWEKSIEALCSAVVDSGLLMIIETFGIDNESSPPHVRWRTQEHYDVALSKLGFSTKAQTKFQYPHEGADKTLLVYSR